MKVIDADGNTVDEWVSTDKPHYIEKLTVGQTYTLIETKPADGYATAQSVKFTVSDTGKVQHIEMIDDYTKVQFAKIDAETGNYVPGAELAIYPADKDGKPILDQMYLKFTTSNAPYVVNYMPIGTYVLREISTPYAGGYVTAEDVVFEVKDTGELQTVTMKDDVTKIALAKVDAQTGEYVSGATLELYKADNLGQPVIAQKIISFTSTDKPFEIERLPIGVYVLREAKAPHGQGYVTADDVVFEITDTPQLQTITMKDDFTKIEVVKIDDRTGEYVKGATLAIYPDDGYGRPVLDECIEEFVTDGTPHRVDYLPLGSYVLREIKAPYDQGYVKAVDVVFKVIDSPLLQTITMKDNFTKVEVAKVDAETGDTLKEQHLQSIRLIKTAKLSKENVLKHS